MKLTDILDEIMGSPEVTISDLTPDQKRELYKTGRLLVPLPQDPNRPEMSASQVINLPKIDGIKRNIIQISILLLQRKKLVNYTINYLER
jgi:hypothetical protein